MRLFVVLVFVLQPFIVKGQVAYQHLFDFDITYQNGFHLDSGYFLITNNNHEKDLTASFISDTKGELLYYATESNVFIENDELYKFDFNNSLGDFTLIHSDLQFTKSDTILGDSLIFDAHDIIALDNGHILLMLNDPVLADLSAYSSENPGLKDSMYLLVPVIVELDEQGDVVFHWRADDYFSFEDVDYTIPVIYYNTYVVYMNINHFSFRSENELIVSFRTAGSVVSIHYPSGNINWIFGGKRNEFTLIGTDTLMFSAQHYAHFRKNDNLIMIDNGTNSSTKLVRAIEYEMDTAAMTAKAVWSYVWDSTMTSSALGSVQLINDSNYLINLNIADSARKDPILLMDTAKTTGMQIIFEDKEIITYEAHYYPHEFPLYRPQTKARYDSATVRLYIDEQADAYFWQDSSTAPSKTVSDTGLYYCYADLGFGYVKSIPVYIDSVPGSADSIPGLDTNSTDTVAVFDYAAENHVKLFPNPGNGHIQLSAHRGEIDRIEIFSPLGLAGRLPSVPAESIDISHLPAGTYFIRIHFASGQYLSRRYTLIK